VLSTVIVFNSIPLSRLNKKKKMDSNSILLSRLNKTKKKRMDMWQMMIYKSILEQLKFKQQRWASTFTMTELQKLEAHRQLITKIPLVMNSSIVHCIACHNLKRYGYS
jgi:protein tyrosine phosphatase